MITPPDRQPRFLDTSISQLLAEAINNPKKEPQSAKIQIEYTHKVDRSGKDPNKYYGR